MPRETAILGGGCFWCLDAVFREVPGVISVECGYAGGTHPNPTYEQVCSGTSGHAEVVRLLFDTGTVSFQRLLQIFFSLHDPTTLNRQGHDIGTQYRSVIFCQSAAQEKFVQEMINDLAQQQIWPMPIVTEVHFAHDGTVPHYSAESYHQNYFALHPGQGYCQAVIAPKLARFRRELLSR